MTATEIQPRIFSLRAMKNEPMTYGRTSVSIIDDPIGLERGGVLFFRVLCNAS